MQTWLDIDEFAKLVKKDKETILQMCEANKLVSKVEDGKRYIETASATSVLVPAGIEDGLIDPSKEAKNGAMEFVEKTIGTILSMHDKVVDAKDETLNALRSENQFLKDGLLAMQELYEEDRKAIEVLTAQLKNCQEELEFTKRKYKLMWGKAIENANANK
ncbi:MAG: DUF3972 domain-containing protein [Helicobacteraceae bacterium]